MPKYKATTPKTIEKIMKRKFSRIAISGYAFECLKSVWLKWDLTLQNVTERLLIKGAEEVEREEQLAKLIKGIAMNKAVEEIAKKYFQENMEDIKDVLKNLLNKDKELKKDLKNLL